MKAIFIILGMMILLVPLVQAGCECVDGGTIRCSVNHTIDDDGSVENIIHNKTSTCIYGCDMINSVCNPTPTNQAFITLGILALIGGVFAIMYKVFK